MASPPWLPRVARLVARWADPAPPRAWVVAVSGGSDSVGLLRALHEVAEGMDLALSVAHLDHGARGDAGRADAAFVEELARSLGLPFDLGRWQPARPAHFEADARRARYAWLAEVAARRGAGAVAVGHTRDDQAETVLHRVLRGTGLRGLAGIPTRRPLGAGVMLVRPLLTVSRQEVRDYLAAIGQPFRDDATNADLSRTRARLRHDLLPKLATDYNPRVSEALARAGAAGGGLDAGIRKARAALERAATVSIDNDIIKFSREQLIYYPPYVRAEVLRLAWRRAGWPEAGMTAARWNRLALRAQKRRPWQADIGAGVVASTGAGLFILRRAGTSGRDLAPLAPADLPLALPGAADWPGGRVVVTLDPDEPRDETVDLDRLFPPLWVRAPVPGDRFNPLGMGRRQKPLNDFFRGRHVAPAERARTPLVCDHFGIVWVVGHRIAHRVRVTERTTRKAGLRWEPAPDPPP